jgi:hypothetical protein
LRAKKEEEKRSEETFCHYIKNNRETTKACFKKLLAHARGVVRKKYKYTPILGTRQARNGRPRISRKR